MAVLNRRFLVTLLLFLAFVAGFALRAKTQQRVRKDADSPVMKRLFEQDQKDRDVDFNAMSDQQRSEWRNRLLSQDAQRRKEVNDIISRGELHTGRDFEEAAVIFQHGSETDDFLFVHVLAVVAVAKGRSQSRWLAAATLDRYLHRMNQPQIYGTESLGTPYSVRGTRVYKYTQDPYNRSLVPDSMRAEMCVPDLGSQEHALELLNRGKESPERTNGAGCMD